MSADWDAFLTLHRDLPREGPGEAADVAWAAKVAGVGSEARILDAACGPGGDITALLEVAPRGHVTACDRIAHFVAAARAAHLADPRVEVVQADMTSLAGPFDLIWCAGAVYFLGVTEALTAWRPILAPGGAIAFSYKVGAKILPRRPFLPTRSGSHVAPSVMPAGTTTPAKDTPATKPAAPAGADLG